MMLLFTVLFLLADGSPASKAYVACDGLVTFEAGNDVEGPGGNVLIIDSRGATIVGAGKAILCFARNSA